MDRPQATQQIIAGRELNVSLSHAQTINGSWLNTDQVTFLLHAQEVEASSVGGRVVSTCVVPWWVKLWR